MKTEHSGIRINEGCEKEERVRGWGRRENRSHKVRIQCFYPRGSSWAGREKKKHKKKALNSYLPTLKEFKRYADVRDPVDPL